MRYWDSPALGRTSLYELVCVQPGAGSNRLVMPMSCTELLQCLWWGQTRSPGRSTAMTCRVQGHKVSFDTTVLLDFRLGDSPVCGHYCLKIGGFQVLEYIGLSECGFFNGQDIETKRALSYKALPCDVPMFSVYVVGWVMIAHAPAWIYGQPSKHSYKHGFRDLASVSPQPRILGGRDQKTEKSEGGNPTFQGFHCKYCGAGDLNE
ncbi:hypothetical protein EGW08_019630 [Elysia chlorotica]|uniref:Uncharacterized protein n=1 Tax=Elysia chlorotica TaxID=188477 RepID=A0A433STL1_ELYCH|nr:hypothetical protein EGW08_019630 [Elysia chlorotica]